MQVMYTDDDVILHVRFGSVVRAYDVTGCSTLQIVDLMCGMNVAPAREVGSATSPDCWGKRLTGDRMMRRLAYQFERRPNDDVVGILAACLTH